MRFLLRPSTHAYRGLLDCELRSLLVSSNGALYDLGGAIIYYIGEAINKPATPEVKIINETSKEVLKAFAYNLSLQIGQDRNAGERQINVTFNLAKQCIDRGECSNEELVTRDVLDSLIRMRPDQHLGNLQAWNAIGEFFMNVGGYVSTKFTDLKQFFIAINSQSSLPTDHAYWGPRVGLVRQETEIMSWYQSPDLMRLIKNIESVFAALGYEMQLNEEFSEEVLSKFLSKFWQILDNQGVNSNSSAEFILTLLETNNFIEQAFNISQEDPRFAELRLPVTELALDTSQPTHAPRRGRRRNKRDVQLEEKSETKISRLNAEAYAEDYLVNHERQQLKHGKNKHHSSIHTNKQIRLVSSPNNQQRTTEKEIKQIPQKKFAKFEQVSDQKQRCSREVNNHTHFKPMKAKQIISISQNNVSTKHTNINKQFLLKTNCSKKLSNLFKGTANNQNKKYLGQEKTIDRILTDNHSSFHPVKTGISRVTAQSDMQTSLFALNFCIKCLSKEKKFSYTSVAKTPKLAKINKKKERLIEAKRNFYTFSSNKN